MARKETNFKQTDIGLIPHDWEVMSLGQIGDVKMCKRIFKSQTKDTGEIPFYKIGTFGQTPDAFISRSIFERYKANYPYPPLGAILLSASGTIGRRVKYQGEDAYFQDSNIIWLNHTENKLLNDFLYYTYSRVSWTTEKGAAISRLYNKLFLSAKIPLPPLEEQRRIAEVLSHFDEHIDNLVALLEKRKQVKSATMHALLSGATRLPGFTTPWQEFSLDSLCSNGDITLYRGKVISNKDIEHFPGVYPIYSSSVSNNGLMGSYGKYMFDEELVSWSVDGGGDFFYRPKHKFSITNVSGYMRVNRVKLEMPFVAYQLQYLHSFLSFDYLNKAHPSVIKNLYTLSLPSTINEQAAIAEILSNMDRGIEALEQEIKKYRQMKEGAMEELLTGKTRLL